MTTCIVLRVRKGNFPNWKFWSKEYKCWKGYSFPKHRENVCAAHHARLVWRKYYTPRLLSSTALANGSGTRITSLWSQDFNIFHTVRNWTLLVGFQCLRSNWECFLLLKGLGTRFNLVSVPCFPGGVDWLYLATCFNFKHFHGKNYVLIFLNFSPCLLLLDLT